MMKTKCALLPRNVKYTKIKIILLSVQVKRSKTFIYSSRTNSSGDMNFVAACREVSQDVFACCDVNYKVQVDKLLFNSSTYQETLGV